MAQFPPVAWADVATKHDVEHSIELVRGDIARLDARTGETRAALRSLFVGLVALQISAAGVVAGVARFL